MQTLPAHLGGHQNETHIDEGALTFMMNKYNIKSYLDVGCGPGGMIELALSKGLDAQGVDGDFTLQRNCPCIVHDFNTGPAPIPNRLYDMAWSVEFLEHVEEKYIPNYIDAFVKCKRIVVTHGVPGQPGHHHVNLQHAEYWVHKFAEYGFLLDVKTTNELRQASTMAQRYIRTTGLVFFNSNLNWQVI